MSKQRIFGVAALAAVTGAGASIASAIVTIPTVPIGNPGNAPDPITGLGSVSYVYNIGTYEVTNAQYAAFLNAVAATDTHSLYKPNMASSLGGILRSGASGSFVYAPISGRESNPVNYITLWDAFRFANWLHNGQPTGPQDSSTTEDGAYTITGIPYVVRNANWLWSVTNVNEWYKAAYHQPANQGGDTDSYWLYPTSSNVTPTSAQANYNNTINNTTPVGSYAANYYGAFDMAGNVWELISFNNEDIVALGGGFGDIDDLGLRADYVSSLPAPWFVGFRLVNVGPVYSSCDRADIDDDGSVTVTDLFGFLDAWFAQFGQSGSGLAADFDGNGSVAVSDLFGYLDAWFEYFGTAC
jgi:hypothetical protein